MADGKVVLIIAVELINYNMKPSWTKALYTLTTPAIFVVFSTQNVLLFLNFRKTRQMAKSTQQSKTMLYFLCEMKNDLPVFAVNTNFSFIAFDI